VRVDECSSLSKSCSCGGSMVMLEEGEDAIYCNWSLSLQPMLSEDDTV
jgi:hypothetical protein